MSNDTTTTTTTPLRAHVRAGSIAWGLIVISGAAIALWVSGSGARRAALLDWMLELTPGTSVLLGVLVLGGILLLAGVLAVIRRAQRRNPR